MIGIFQGRGIADTARVHAQIDVDFRDHVHAFNSGRNLNALAVFICIALHANQDGWAFPGRELLKKETGLSSDSAISSAIQHLRRMEIEGVPVLAHYRLKDETNKRWDRSLYLIFPTLPHGAPPEKLTKGCEMFIVKNDKPQAVDPPPTKPGVAKPGVANPGYKKNHVQEEPSISTSLQTSDTPNDQQPPTDALDDFGLTGEKWKAKHSTGTKSNGKKPWRTWCADVVRPHSGVPAHAVQEVGWTLENLGMGPPRGIKSRMNTWIAGCAELYQGVAGDMKPIEHAYKYAERNGLTIPRPQSLFDLAMLAKNGKLERDGKSIPVPKGEVFR